ncbi:unnamed protein product [Urochloa humidicola]
MGVVRIFCHADIQALQDRFDEQLMSVELVSLESLRIASDSCALLVNLIEGRDWERPKVVNLTKKRYWRCPQMDILSLMAGVALEFHKIKHDLYPHLVFQEAKLEGGFLKDLLLKNSAVTLVGLAKAAKKIVEGCDESDDTDDSDDMDELSGIVVPFRMLLGKVKEVGEAVEDTADLVLKGTHNIAWLQARLPSVLDPVDSLLLTPIHFPE